MRVLIVYCHPDPESFTAAIRDRVLAALAANGHETQLVDLYAQAFDPVLSRTARRAYHEAGANERGVERHLEALRWADALLFVHPTWWYGPPAMLKGWMDRVWVPHATFTMPEGRKPIGRVLTNIRVLGVVTTLGSPRWWWAFMGMPGRRMMLTGLGVLCAPRCRTLWLALHGIDTATPARRSAFLDRVGRRLRRL